MTDDCDFLKRKASTAGWRAGGNGNESNCDVPLLGSILTMSEGSRVVGSGWRHSAENAVEKSWVEREA